MLHFYRIFCDFCKILTSCFSFAWLACKTFQAMAVTAKRSKRANYYKTFFSILAMHVACHVPKSCILHMLCSQSPLLWSQDTICNLTEWKALIFIHFHVLTHFWYIDSSRNIRILWGNWIMIHGRIIFMATLIMYSGLWYIIRIALIV